MRKPLAKVACHNASNSLIDLLDPLFGANTQPRPRYHAEDEQRQKAERERFTNHLRELPGFIDVSSDHKHRAIRQPPADGPNQRVARLPLIDPRNPHALYRLVNPELMRHAREVAGKPVPICIKQPGKQNPAGIPSQMIVNRVDETIGWQSGKEIQLVRNHPIGPCDQIVVDLPVNEAKEQCNEYRKKGSNCRRPAKSVRS
jgi:hypothetical protein